MLIIKDMSRQPDIISRSIAVVGLLIIILMFTLAAYLNSFIRGKIDKNIFTVSQALAFGNKPAMISMLSGGIMLLMFLNYYRGLRYLPIRLFLLLVIYSFILSLLWVTTFYNKKDHYILAFIIFISSIVYIILSSMAIYSFNKSSLSQASIILLYAIPIFAILGFIGLIVGNIKIIKEKVPQIFPSFENYVLFMVGLSTLTLGFM